MYVLKICLQSDRKPQEIERLLMEAADHQSTQIHVQHIDSTAHSEWLCDQTQMRWKTIFDVIWSDGDPNMEAEMKRTLCLVQKYPSIIQEADCYCARQMTYQDPVPHAELITSCYYWNYNTLPEVREEKMREHFAMEQKQIYYDYVAFQSVFKVLTPHSPQFDFFFESHVSKPEGIDHIYSTPELNGMREHSESFLDVGSRRLSFGSVSCYGE